MPFSRTYVVNDTNLIPALQKQWRTISFAAHAGDLWYQLAEAHHTNHGAWKDLDTLSRASIKVLAEGVENLRRGNPDTGSPVTGGLWQWTRRTMTEATTDAVWGPLNPFRDPKVSEAWPIFEAGFLTLSVLPMPWLLIPRLFRACEVVASSMINYMSSGGLEMASPFVRALYQHNHERFGLSVEDVGRGQLGLSFAVLGSSTPCALWLLYHIFSDDRVLSDVRTELEAIVSRGEEDGMRTNSIDLASMRTSCPLLLSTLQETMRYRTVSPGIRKVLKDVTVGGWLLRKGSMLMIPTTVQHTSVAAWGDSAGAFDHRRFVTPSDRAAKKMRPFNKVAFRAFGGGHVLCPGRHFASNEIMALAALVVLQFDVVPVNDGRWPTPTWRNSPITAGFPIIDDDIEVEFRPRDPDTRWDVTFSGSNEAMAMVSEELSGKD